MAMSTYQHFFCYFCHSPMDDDADICVRCTVENDDQASWWDDEREWYVLKDDDVVSKYMKED